MGLSVFLCVVGLLAAGIGIWGAILLHNEGSRGRVTANYSHPDLQTPVWDQLCRSHRVDGLLLCGAHR